MNERGLRLRNFASIERTVNREPQSNFLGSSELPLFDMRDQSSNGGVVTLEGGEKRGEF